MSFITEENKQAWSEVIKKTNDIRPYVGRTVQITKGKNKGLVGKVTWHGVDKFYTGTRHMNGAQMMMLQAMGTVGYRVRIQPSIGDAVFCKADQVAILE